MNLTIHRGSKQIGGSCVEVESQGKRLLIDLGLPLDAEGELACYLRAIADATGNYDLLRKLARIQDNKGSLYAYWREAPTDEEKTVLKKAWLSQCEDGELIEHEPKATK